MKKIIKMITAFTAAICLTVSAFAANPVTGGDYVGTLKSTAYSQYSKRFSVRTQNTNESVDEIFAGLSVNDYYTGGQYDYNDDKNYNSDDVRTYCYVSYGSGAKKVTSFGAHSAYNNGKQTCMLYSSHNFTI